MTAPDDPPRKRSTPQATNHAGRLSTIRLKAEYHLLTYLQMPFGFVFWAIEQRKDWLWIRSANEGREL